MPSKLEKREKVCFYKIILPLHYQTLSDMLWFYENDSISERYIFRHVRRQYLTFNKNKRYHMTLEGLSAKLEPASCKNNKILKINALQKFTSHAPFAFYQ